MVAGWLLLTREVAVEEEGVETRRKEAVEAGAVTQRAA